jgi:hypothetical protein
MTSFVLGVITGAGLFWLAENWKKFVPKKDESKMDRPPSKRT